MSTKDYGITVLGLGAMGRALVSALLDAGHPVTVWNRTSGKDSELVDRGAERAIDVRSAVDDAALLVVCLLDAASVRERLEPIADTLRGKAVVNLTSTTPEQSRELARWAARQGIDFLDGAILAIPPMIGHEGSALYYSGASQVFETWKPLFELWGEAEYFGTDAGIAAQYDFSLLAAMYLMFAGGYQALAMMASAGVPAREFAPRLTAWIRAMAPGMEGVAPLIDSGDYRADTQTLDFNKTGIDEITGAARDNGVDVSMLESLRALVDREVAAGHGALSFARVFESIARP